jgi:DHA1 family inner membrane transport protein
MRVNPLVALTAATFAVGIGELAVAGMLPPLASDLHVAIPIAGQLVSGYALTFALLTPPLAATFGGRRRKSGLLAGLLIAGIANVLAAVAPTYLALLGARMLAAAGSAIVSPLALSLIDDVVGPQRRGRAQGIVFAGFSVAMTIGVPLGAIVAGRADWRAVFGLIAAVCFVAAALAALLHVPPPVAAPLAFRRRSLVRRVLSPLIMRILAISFFSMTAQYVVFTYIRPYFAETGPSDLNSIAALLFLLGFLGIAGNIGGGFALDRWGARGAILWCLGANVAIFIAMRFVHGPLAAVVPLVVVWGVASWAFSPGVNHALAQAAGDQRDIALALNLTAINVGIAAGAAIGGAIVATTGVADVVYGGAALLAVALAIAIRLPRAQRR